MEKALPIAQCYREGKRAVKGPPEAEAYNCEGYSKGCGEVASEPAGNGGDGCKYGAAEQAKGGALACNIALQSSKV